MHTLLSDKAETGTWVQSDQDRTAVVLSSFPSAKVFLFLSSIHI